MFLGNWDIDDYLTFTACTHDDTGAAADADAVPSYAIYEDETAAAIVSGNMAQLGAVTGFYTERVQLTAANGFETGKCYAVRVEATVGGVTAAAAHSFAVKTASANVTLWKDQTAPDAPPSKAELDALETHGDATWATADVSALATAAALATVDGIVDAIKLKTDLISADGSVSVTAAISGSTITILRGDSLSVAIAGLGDISTRSKLWFTAKQDTGDADTSAIIQLEETDGLVRLNGAAGTAVLGEITVTDEDAGDITITLDETATDDLTPRRNMSYDVQVLTATGTVTTLTSGTLHVTADVTRAVA